MAGIFDTHAHYESRAFNADRETLLGGLAGRGVCGVVNCGTNMKSSRKSVELAEKYDFIYAAVGFHPGDAHLFKDEDLAELERLSANPKVVALGEMGLDYHYDSSLAVKAMQKAVFSEQLDLAEKLSLPVVLHSREALADTLEMVFARSVRAVFHCFSESAEVAQQLVKRGHYIGLGGVLTFKNARRAVESARVVPLDRILIETDAPYMAPDGHRGERNDSSLLGPVAERLAEIKGVSREYVLEKTEENARRFFEI